MKDFIVGFKEAFTLNLRQSALKRASVTILISMDTYRGIDVFESNDFIYGHTGLYRAPGAVTTNIEGRPIILINRAFLKLSKDIQQAIYAHEYAHILLDHVNQLEDINNTKSRIELEYEADLYARDVLGADIYKVLKYFLSNKIYKEKRIREELVKRIFNLSLNIA